MHNLMDNRLDITLNRVIKIKLADLGVRGALSKDRSTILTLHHPDVWRTLTQRNTRQLRVIQMGYSIGETHLAESQLSLMNNLFFKVKLGVENLNMKVCTCVSCTYVRSL